jgi:hypothetical protein
MSYSKLEINKLISESFYPDPKSAFNLWMMDKKIFPYTIVKAPKSLSLLDNTEEVINFLNEISENLKKRAKTYVQFTDVTFIDDETLVVLLCLLVNFKTANLPFSGAYPYNNDAKTKLKDSIFHQYVFKNITYGDRYSFSKGNLDTSANIYFDATLTSSMIRRASTRIWGTGQRCCGVQGALIELMRNTNKHSDLRRRNAHHYWLAVQLKENDTVKFSFFDLGAGVFKSIKNKVYDRSLSDWEPKSTHRHYYDNNAELLKLIFTGRLCDSLVDEPNVGKGLAAIKDALDREHISNLRIITNDVSASVKTGVYSLLSQSFAGTFLSWEVNSSNKHFAA